MLDSPYSSRQYGPSHLHAAPGYCLTAVLMLGKFLRQPGQVLMLGGERVRLPRMIKHTRLFHVLGLCGRAVFDRTAVWSSRPWRGCPGPLFKPVHRLVPDIVCDRPAGAHRASIDAYWRSWSTVMPGLYARLHRSHVWLHRGSKGYNMSNMSKCTFAQRNHCAPDRGNV